MRAIFISYRRDDAAGEAGRLFDDLTAKFGPDKVFMDVAGIEPGRDFRKVIDQNVASCGVLLSIIGKGWVDAKDDAGRRRLDDPLDFVRLETASALKRDIVVIPVLVRGGQMPRAEQLPEDLTELAYRNGVELTHARWRSDVEVLIKALRAHVGNAEKESGSVDQSTSGSVNQAAVAVRSPFLGRALVGGAVAIVVAAAAVWYQFFSPAFAISRVDTAEPFVANGKPYDVMVEFKTRNKQVQNVEVHFVRGDTTWNPNSWTAKVSTDANNLGRASVGTMSYRSTKPASVTFQYVLIATDGKRSQPYEKTFNIAPGPLLPATATTQTADRMRNNQQIGYRDNNGNAFCANCATVIGVREVAQGRETTGAGAVVGGLLGGALGDQVSHGRANDAATAAGAIAGALAGHQVEKNVRSSKVYEITVHYDDGRAEVIRQSTPPPWRNGDRVQIVNGVLRYAP
jgi:outer membrane lipoprotein SlyB